MNFHLKKRIITFRVPPYHNNFFRSLKFLGIFCLVMVGVFYIVDFRIRPTLLQLAMTQAKVIATRAINEAIRADITPDIQYQNLIKLQLNTEGQVTLIQPNTGEINRISSEATLAVQKRLENLPNEVIRIPFGQIAGSKIMAGFGPKIPVKVIPIGFVTSNINDRFVSTGINQVRHQVFLTINATIKLVVPLVNQEVRVSSDVPLVETVIVGEVPQVYVENGDGVILPGTPAK